MLRNPGQFSYMKIKEKPTKRPALSESLTETKRLKIQGQTDEQNISAISFARIFLDEQDPLYVEIEADLALRGKIAARDWAKNRKS